MKKGESVEPSDYLITLNCYHTFAFSFKSELKL